MDDHNTMLQLISFSSRLTCDAFCLTLADLGYTVRHKLADNWLSSDDPNVHIPTVLLITQTTYPKSEILCKLKKPRSLTFLGVFSRNDRDWDIEILSCFDDFVFWPCSKAELFLRLKRACPEAVEISRVISEETLLDEFANLKLIGRSSVFLNALQLVKKVAIHDIPVLIEGETGTGKELVARAIHYLSARRDFPFIPINCGAIPDNLFENELFGHERGAFTDAQNAQPGTVALAQGGTLFLDEVDTLTTKAQIGLLRFLQDQEYKPLGSDRYKKADVRIIAATNADLSKRSTEKRFRPDLLFRLNIMPIIMPPLRERPEDISLLADHFIRQFVAFYDQPTKTIHPKIQSWMNRYRWPGNVRELENFIHRQFLLTEGAIICGDIQTNSQQNRRKNIFDRSQDFSGTTLQTAKAKVIADFEKKYLIWVLKEAKGNVTQAARIAGKERRALGKLLKKYEISKSADLGG